MTVNIAQALVSQVEDHCLHWRVRCWRITVTVVENKVFRLTDHSEDLLLFDGEVYKTMGGMDTSAIRRVERLDVINKQVRGLVTILEITDLELKQGVFDGAIVDEYTVDSRMPFIAPIDYIKYSIASMTFDGSLWNAELRGITHELTRPSGDVWGPMCRVELFSQGNGKCNLASAPFIENNTIDSIVTNNFELKIAGIVNAVWKAVGYGDDGRLTFLTGSNAGFTADIKRWVYSIGPNDGIVTLQQNPPFGVVAGDVLTMEPGCNKRFDGDCLVKFNNLINHQGEPFIPGGDLVREGASIV